MKPPRGGRPRIDPFDISVDIHIRLPAKQYDLTERKAAAARLTLNDFIREAITKACRDSSKA